jgi:hypothetical protein
MMFSVLRAMSNSGAPIFFHIDLQQHHAVSSPATCLNKYCLLFSSTTSWDVTPCSLAQVFEEHTASVFKLKHLAKQEERSCRLAKCSMLKMGAVLSSKMLVTSAN